MIFRSIKTKLLSFLIVLLFFTVLASTLATNWVLSRTQKEGILVALGDSWQMVEVYLESQKFNLRTQSQLVGILPILSIVVENNDPATILDTSKTYQEQLHLAIFDVFDNAGELLASGNQNFEHSADTLYFIDQILDEITPSVAFSVRNQRLSILASAAVGIPDEPSGVLLVGAYLDEKMARLISAVTNTQITFITGRNITGSSLTRDEQRMLMARVGNKLGSSLTASTIIESDTHIMQLNAVTGPLGGQIGVIVIQRALKEAHRVTQQVRNLLIGIGAGLLLILIPLGIFIADRVAKPIITLTESAAKVAQGNLEHTIDIRQQDELGQLAVSFLTMRDAIRQRITDLKFAYKSLATLNAELELRIEKRTEKLRATIEDLKAAQTELVNKEKMASLGSLVAGVAHEINTPLGIGLTGISHVHRTTQLLQTQYANEEMTEAAFVAYLGNTEELSYTIQTALQRAANLIRSFKQVAVDQHGDQQRRFSVHEYLEAVILSLHNQLKHTSIEVLNEVDPALELNSYPGIFSQIFTNLIVNSIIHGFDSKGRADSCIQISTEKCASTFILSFRDNGNGIPAEIFHRIFEPFFTTRRGQGGSGLGLHIVYNLVTQKLGGEIHCDSTPGQGVLFSLDLPYGVPNE